jgi:isorenieratene synthase
MGFELRRTAGGRWIGILGQRLAPLVPDPSPTAPADWVQARPARIRAALAHALALPSGGWFVLDDARRIAQAPVAYTVQGQRLVAWREGGALRVAPDRCPHMGAPLSAGRVRNGCLVCPWHGLTLDARGHGAWRPLSAHDDGVLAWVRLGAADPDVPLPSRSPRPERAVSAVVRVEARCEPRDVIANRLDPWHGAHYHPHAFAQVRVLSHDERGLTVRVAYRVAGPLCVEVDARFHCPDPRTITMTILAGEGAGSVVETHATPLAPGRTAIIEATLATSTRPAFRHALRAGCLIRPWIERAVRRLWVDDAAYAEHLQTLRNEASEDVAT